MKVLLAGGTGAIGRPLLKRLIADRHKVAALVRSEESSNWVKAQGARAEFVDVFDRGAIGDLFARLRPDIVINQLRKMPKHYNPDAMRAAAEPDRRVRRTGGGNLEAAAKESGVYRYILQSSAFWYAPGKGLADENTGFAFDAPEAISAGARFYQEMEQRALATLGPAVTIVRYGFLYGPGTYNARQGDVSEQVRRGSFPIIGDATGVWSWVHVEDAADATAALISRGQSGVYNLVDDDPMPMAEWLPAYARWLEAPPPPKIPIEQVRDDGSKYYAIRLRGASNGKAKREFGFRPRPLEWLARRPRSQGDNPREAA